MFERLDTSISNSSRNSSQRDIDNVLIEDASLKYLSIVEPFPMEPPDYLASLPKSTIPIYNDFAPKNEPLPGYKPTVYKLAIVYKKVEWLTPFEMANQRHWKPFIAELNNTQLNFYECPINPNKDLFHKFDTVSSMNLKDSNSYIHPFHFQNLYLNKSKLTGLDHTGMASYNESNYISSMTTENDLKALNYFKSIKALESTQIKRSYTLQYGRIGSCIDYKNKERKWVFRCRFETEQFLIHFPNCDSMVEWYYALTLGIDNSLDLSRREMPTYKTVPNRRPLQKRRLTFSRLTDHHSLALNIAKGMGIVHGSNTSGNSSSNHTADTRKSIGNLTKRSGSSSSLKKEADNLRSTLFRRRGSSVSSSNSLNAVSNMSGSHTSTGKLSLFMSKSFTKISSLSDKDKGNFSNLHKSSNKDKDYSLSDNYKKLTINNPTLPFDVSNTDDEAVSNVKQNESVFADSNLRPHSRETEDDYEGEDEEHEEEEEEEEEEGETGHENAIISEDDSSVGANIDSTNFLHECDHLRRYDEYIEKPRIHYPTKKDILKLQRKIIRDAVRCMKPLLDSKESWNNKFVLINRSDYYRPQSRQMVHNPYQCMEIKRHQEYTDTNYKHRFQRPLQEYIVTPSGIIPYINPNFDR